MKRGPTPIYPQEAASVPYLLDLCGGDKVLEAGTGSGILKKTTIKSTKNKVVSLYSCHAPLVLLGKSTLTKSAKTFTM